ncbi:MAG: zinc-ribbon domain-containing protein [Candidatus Fimivivens sp.]|nr:zinc-ribbon domain-containing protein [Candidatus Fimivivens sp.]
MMAFCQNCGVQLNDGIKFCPNCGALVQAEPGVAPVPQEINPAAVPMSAAEPMQTAAASVAVLEKETDPAAPVQEQPASQPAAYQQPASQPAAYQQSAPQPGAYQQPAPQPGVYQQPAPQPAAYQQPTPQPAAYQQPAPQPGVYQQPAPQPGMYQQPAPQPGMYQQPAQGYVPSEAQMKKGMAILAYFGILFLIPLFAAKKDPFARYHTNQGLVLFIFMVIFNVLSNVLTSILIEISPMLVLIVSGVFGILTLLLCIFALIGIIRAAKGQMKPLPIIGGIRILK